MNRLSWDTTAPRRPAAKRSPSDQHRPDDVLAAAADLIRVAWEPPFRVTNY